MGNYCVYKHTSPDGKVYIGITGKNPLQRWRGGKGYFQNIHFSRAIEKYGWDNFEHEILLDGLTKSAACAAEMALIKACKSNLPQYGYNHSVGGDAPNLGSVRSLEAVEKTAAANRGRKRAPDAGQHISEAKKGRPNGLEGRTGAACAKSGIVKQINEQTGKVVCLYCGYDEMARMTGYAKTPVKEAAAGKRKRAYGWLWEYAKRGD